MKLDIQKKFVKMMIPVCADIIDNKTVDISEIISMQNVFMYAVTGDFFFIQKMDESKKLEQIRQIQAYLYRIKTLQFNGIPQAIGMAQIWWDGLYQLFESAYPILRGDEDVDSKN